MRDTNGATPTARDDAAEARAILQRLMHRMRHGEAFAEPAIDEIAAALTKARADALAEARRAAFHVGGRYNWDAMNARDRRTDRLAKAQGAWEAWLAIRKLDNRIEGAAPDEPLRLAGPPSRVARLKARIAKLGSRLRG